MSRVVHFEIPADDPQRLVKFFESAFGWRFHKWEGPMEYWLVMTGDDAQPGINGGLMRRQHPGQPCVNTLGVPSVDAACAAVEKAGGQVVVPKMPIPGVGWLAYFKDPEGNIHGVMQDDDAAQ